MKVATQIILVSGGKEVLNALQAIATSTSLIRMCVACGVFLHLSCCRVRHAVARCMVAYVKS